MLRVIKKSVKLNGCSVKYGTKKFITKSRIVFSVVISEYFSDVRSVLTQF